VDRIYLADAQRALSPDRYWSKRGSVGHRLIDVPNSG